ncbi:alcohol dehydrogenase catalytic domain-containing protein [Brevibacterium yomogidense]|uniref:alcohol dehydrogenase catalytic domain-containing protein n=1 Tax=Brevibacterium yomogidense TaxID=946573 RepID=UPI001C4F51D2
MRKIICTEYGKPDLLALVEEPQPTPGPGEVLVRVEAAGVSFVDSLIVRGAYQVEPPLPFTPGNCSVGVVTQVGEGVDESYAGGGSRPSWPVSAVRTRRIWSCRSWRWQSCRRECPRRSRRPASRAT